MVNEPVVAPAGILTLAGTGAIEKSEVESRRKVSASTGSVTVTTPVTVVPPATCVGVSVAVALPIVIVTGVVVVTVPAVAANDPDALPVAATTLAGTVNAALELETARVSPPAGAGALNV